MVRISVHLILVCHEEPMMGVTYRTHGECKCYHLVNCKYCEFYNISDTVNARSRFVDLVLLKDVFTRGKKTKK